MQLLKEQSEIFHEVQSEFDSDVVHDTYDNSENDVILSLKTQLKETIELVSRFSYEKYCALNETESLKVEIKSLQTENKVLKSREFELSKKIDQMKSQVLELSEKLQISNQEMKQQIILFKEDKRMFLAKNDFQEKVSFLMQKEYNDLLAFNDVLKQRLETKFKFSKHDTSLEKMIEMIEKEYESNQGTEVTKDQVQTSNSQSTAPVQLMVIQSESETPVFEPVVAPVSAPMPNLKPSIPYPSRRDNERRHDQANEQIEKFYEIFKDMSFEISFTDALMLMPKFASTLKALIRNKEKLSEMARTQMNEHCSVPKKLGDPRKFRLSLPELTPTCMTLELVDRTESKPIGNEYYCFLDGFSGYFQIPIDPRDQEKTTFTCPYETFAYHRMPFRLCNATGTFQRCMLAIFHDMVEKTMEVFMDEFSVFGNSFENCLSRLDKMLQ
nr:reverse transcriptase domain-containing protein [Tanacetum cinerariifolium]